MTGPLTLTIRPQQVTVQAREGPPGPTGSTGETGPTGDIGSPGPQGDQGETGDQGPIGNTGAQGLQGLQGPQGEIGEQGDTGDQGPMGQTGAIGPQGPRGPEGEKGETGDDGDKGSTGMAGPTIANAVFGDGVSTDSVAAGSVCYVRVPYGGSLIQWDVVADVACTCSIDVWKRAGAVPTVANTITASAKPGLTASQVGESTALTGWTVAVTAGDVLGFKLESLSGGLPTQINLSLKVLA